MISDRDTRWKFTTPSSTTTSLIEQKRNLSTCGLGVDQSQDTALCQRMSSALRFDGRVPKMLQRTLDSFPAVVLHPIFETQIHVPV